MDENNEEWDENGFDPTKEAFFSDLMEMEEDIAAEGYNLVEHAISLINTQYYDDAIEVLRQAIGVYTQINRDAEINAIKQKISETYVQKEQYFRENEIKPEIIEDSMDQIQYSLKTDMLSVEEPSKIDIASTSLIVNADELIKDAKQLVEIEEFDDAIEKYDEALKIYEELGDDSIFQVVNDLIEDCYNKKVKFLHKTKKKTHIDEELPQESLQIKSVKAYEDKKKRERHLSDLAYKLMGKASELSSVSKYDEAIELYDEVSILFSQLNWEYELEKVKETIKKLTQEKDQLLIKVESPSAISMEESDIYEKHTTQLDNEAKLRTQELELKAQKVLEIEKKKKEDALFGSEIVEMVDKAEKLAREYESALRKNVKKTLAEIQSPYSEVIKIYSDIKNKLIKRGWVDQVEAYNNQISIYKQKLAKDANLRKVEEQKAKRAKDIDEMHKKQQPTMVPGEIERKLSEISEDKLRIEEEKIDLDKRINNLIRLTQEMESDYENSVKQGNLIECPYEEIIEIYTNIQKMLVEKGLNQTAAVYNNSIRLYSEKLIKDDKLREDESEKILKSKEFEEMQKLESIEDQLAEFEKKMQAIEEIRTKEAEDEDFDSQINELIKNIDRMDREYMLAIKKKNFIECPYPEIINIYRKIKKMMAQKGLKSEATIYNNSIQLYKKKYEQDKRLRAVEAKKLEKDQEYKKTYMTKQVSKTTTVETLDEKKKVNDEILEKAMAIIDEVEKRVKKYELSFKKDILTFKSPYDDAIVNYRKVRKLFIEIGWNDEANRLINTIKFYKDKKQKDEQLRILENERIKKNTLQQQQLAKKRIISERSEKEEKLQEELRKKEEEKLSNEKLRDKALFLMDQGKRDLIQKNFDEAIEHYKESEAILQDIGWKEGVLMARESVEAIIKKKEDFETRQKKIELRKTKKAEIKSRLDEKLSKIKDINLLEEEKQKKSLLDKENLIKRENKLSKEAYTLLEQGTVLLNKKKFKDATEKYIQARDIFKKINWNIEVSRINSELLFKVKDEQREHEKLLALRRRSQEAKEERGNLIQKVQEHSKEPKITKKFDVIDHKIVKTLEKANVLIDELNCNEGTIKLNEAIKLLEKVGKNDEILKLKRQIKNLRRSSFVPIITSEDLSEDDNVRMFESAYLSLDKANISISSNRLMKAISELKEAKFNLRETKIGSKFFSEIETKIIKYRNKLGNMDQINAPKLEEREMSQSEEDVLKTRIEARRSERAKRVKDLLKEK